MISRSIPLAFLVTVYANPAIILRSDDSCTPCNPSGATGLDPPAIGNDLQSLYVDVLASVKDIHFRKRWTDEQVEKRTDSLCCAETLDCVNLQTFNIPMCYDKFTTNYAFADGTYGSLTTGEYDYVDGSKANLLTGDYTNSTGATGNLYSSDPSAKPNTATLSIPPQWTGTGVGSAIPATAIASYGPVTGTGAAATTTGPTAVSTSSRVASSVSATASAHVQSSGATASASKGAAAPASGNSNVSLCMSLISALMYAIHAL